MRFLKRVFGWFLGSVIAEVTWVRSLVRFFGEVFGDVFGEVFEKGCLRVFGRVVAEVFRGRFLERGCV